jgi:hypothetical protein
MKKKKTPASYIELLEQFPKQSVLLLEEVQDSFKGFLPIDDIKWSLDPDNIYAQVGKKIFSTSIKESNLGFLLEMPADMFKYDPLYQQIKWLILDDVKGKFGEPAQADRAKERATLLLQALHNSIENTIKEYFEKL